MTNKKFIGFPTNEGVKSSANFERLEAPFGDVKNLGV